MITYQSTSTGTLYAYVTRMERSVIPGPAAMFDCRDKYGKEIGHRCFIEREVYVLADGNNRHVMVPVADLENWIGERFTVKSQCTRNGKDYQSCKQAGKRFATLEEARAQVEKVMIKARKAAALKGV